MGQKRLSLDYKRRHLDKQYKARMQDRQKAHRHIDTGIQHDLQATYQDLLQAQREADDYKDRLECAEITLLQQGAYLQRTRWRRRRDVVWAFFTGLAVGALILWLSSSVSLK